MHILACGGPKSKFPVIPIFPKNCKNFRKSENAKFWQKNALNRSSYILIVLNGSENGGIVTKIKFLL